jgi:UDP-N-acetylglucosamine 2-epimerase (non-hydrolysing)
MKVLTILGTRPEIIRLSRLIAKLDALCDHVLVHTGQNYAHSLNGLLFEQLGIRAPNHDLGIQSSQFGEQVGQILAGVEKVLLVERPGRLLILGDTNSGLSAVVAKRMGIPVYHMEAGNRCYDDRVPEEINRRIIDHSSDILLPYTERSRQNLLREGIPGERIYVTGNPIYEVIEYYRPQIQESRILSELDLNPQRYFLVTMHRAENVDSPERLKGLAEGLQRLQAEYAMPVIISTHPRTQVRMKSFGVKIDNQHIRFLEPFGFFDFIALEQNAFCVLSDSGTVQEECCIFKVPNVTIRDVTERPETIEHGSNILSGAQPEAIVRCVHTVLDQKNQWTIPPEYVVPHVSSTVVKILSGYLCSYTQCLR